jgi:hypothetical protein
MDEKERLEFARIILSCSGMSWEEVCDVLLQKIISLEFEVARLSDIVYDVED